MKRFLVFFIVAATACAVLVSIFRGADAEVRIFPPHRALSIDERNEIAAAIRNDKWSAAWKHLKRGELNSFQWTLSQVVGSRIRCVGFTVDIDGNPVALVGCDDRLGSQSCHLEVLYHGTNWWISETAFLPSGYPDMEDYIFDLCKDRQR